MRIAIFFVLIAFSAVLGQKKAAPKAELLFTAGKTQVYSDEFEILYRKNHQNKPEDFTSTKVNEYFDLFVNFKLKVNEALARGLDTTAAFQKEFDQYRADIKRPFLAKADDLDALVKEAYQRSTEQVRAAHILLLVKPDASPEDTLKAWQRITDLRQRALKGENFTDLAKEFSEDPSAKTNGGDMGYFSAFEMVYPFETAAYNTKPGEVSPIVRTRFGYHVLKVADRRPNPGEVEVSHIMLRFNKDDKEASAKAREKAFQVVEQLKSGRKWEEVCTEFSEDPNTKSNGGRMRKFGVGAFSANAPEFEQMAYALQKEGEISDPFATAFGWHVMRLEKKHGIQPLKEMQASLSRRVSRDERLSQKKNIQLAQLKKQFQYKEVPGTRAVIEALVDSAILKAKWKYPRQGQHVALPACAVSGTPKKLADFLKYAEAQQTPGSAAPKAAINKLYESWVEKLLNEAEEAQLILAKPEYKVQLAEYREGILLFTIMEQEVWNKASNDSIGQRKFYEATLQKYKAGDRVEARIFGSDERQKLESFKTKVLAGDTITQADLRKLKTATNPRAFEKGESKVVDGVPWAIGLHDKEHDGLFYLVEISKLIPPGVKSFEDARASVISDYQEIMEKEWVAALKKKYAVKVNSKAKKAVISALAAKK